MSGEFESLFQQMADRAHWASQPLYKHCRHWISTKEFARRAGLSVPAAYGWLSNREGTSIVRIHGHGNKYDTGNLWHLK